MFCLENVSDAPPPPTFLLLFKNPFNPIISDFQIHLLINPKPGLRLCSYFLSAYFSIHFPALSSPRFLSGILIYPAHTVQTVQFNQTNAGIHTYAGIHPYT